MGYYGVGNLGDEAILSVILKRLKREFSNPEIYVFSHNPQKTEKLHGVASINYLKFKKQYGKNIFKIAWDMIRIIYYIIFKLDYLLIGGGGILYGKSTIIYGFWAVIAKLAKKKVEFYAVGVAPQTESYVLALELKPKPIKNKIGRFLISLAMNMADKVSVRDEYSARVLRLSGVSRQIEIVDDPAMELNCAEKGKIIQILTRLGIGEDELRNSCIVGLSIRYIPNDKLMSKLLDIVSSVVDWLIRKFNCKVILIPFCKDEEMIFNNDLLPAYRIKNKLIKKDDFYIIEDDLTPEEAKGIISLMDVFIGMRLHSLIFAYSTGVPSVGIVYDVKVKSFLDKIKSSENCIYLSDISYKKIKNLIEGMFKEVKSHTREKEYCSNNTR